MPQGAEGSAAQTGYIKKEDYDKVVSEADAAKKEAQSLLEIKNRYLAMNQKYNSDPKFKEAFDKIWEGKFEDAKPVESKSEEKKSPEQEKLTHLESTIQDLNKKIEHASTKANNLDNLLAYQNAMGARSSISQEYRSEFTKLAEKAGFIEDSPAFNALFKNATQNGYNLAHKYNLVNQQGAPDPLLKFTPQLIKESFDLALEEFSGMGYDVKAQQRKEALERQKKKVQTEDDWQKPYIDPKNNKTMEQRAANLEKLFNETLRRNGITREQAVRS